VIDKINYNWIRRIVSINISIKWVDDNRRNKIRHVIHHDTGICSCIAALT